MDMYTLQVSGVTTAFKCGSESRKLSFHVCTEQLTPAFVTTAKSVVLQQWINV